MATYNQLLIGAGGGIVNHHQQSEQQAGATVAIGIGGTGASALAKLKREVYRKIKPDNPEAAVPAYNNIRFLLIDSDDSKLEGHTDMMDLDIRTEFFDISSKAVRKSFNSKEYLAGKKELSWLDYEHITVKEACMDGAGGIRQVGRFLLFAKASALRTKLKAVINEAVTGVQGGNLSVHIFSGLSGGTGGGCFLDVCYILRDVLEEMGKENVRISGYFFLPDVNLSIPSIAATPKIAEFIKVNGYAALKELDYLMELELNGDSFTQDYGEFSISSKMTPVDLCYLVSSTQTDGTLVENGYDYAMSVTTDYVLAFISRVELPEGVEAGDNDGGQTLQGHIANLEQAKAGITKMHGASVDYNIIGASDATMPLSDITTYLGTKLFEKFSLMWNQSPSPAELNDFATKSQLTYEGITAQLTKGITWKVGFPELDPRKVRAGNAQIVERADDWLANTRGTLTKNFQTLSESLAGYYVPRNSTSLIGRTFQQLHDLYAVNYDKGPFFAMRLLGGRDNRNLLHVIDGYIAKAEAELSAEYKQNGSLDDQLDNAKTRLARSNFLTVKGRCGDYLRILNRQYVHLGRIRQYQLILELLRLYRKQVVQLNNDFFTVLTTVLDTLQSTFKENSNILTGGVRTESTYTWSVLSIPDIRDSLDEQVEKMDVGLVTREFLDNMFDEYRNWLSQDPNRIRKMVSDFVVAKFDDITNRTFLDYLKIKFGTSDSNKLQDKIKTEIIENKLSDRSEPLFWCNSMFSIDNVATNCVLSVPFNVPEIVQAAEEFRKGDSQFTVRRTGLMDRMSMMRFYSGVPLYAYQGLEQLELAYERDNKPGRHLYSSPEKDWNKILPSPIPASFRVGGYKNERVDQNNRSLQKEFEEARALGIIFEDNGQWTICETINCDDTALLREIEACRIADSNDVKRAQNLQAKLSGLLEKAKMAENKCYTVISIKGAHKQYREKVLTDNYYRYPVLNQKVSDELGRRAAWKAAESKLNELLSGVGVDGKQKEKFFNAVFTGCIQMLQSKMIYEYDEYGIMRTVDLQNAKMPYSRCAVYQAFLTYLSLDEDVRKKIDDDTADKMDGMNPQIYECAAKIRSKYTKDFLKIILDAAYTDPKYGEIEFFYKEFMKALLTHLEIYK